MCRTHKSSKSADFCLFFFNFPSILSDLLSSLPDVFRAACAPAPRDGKRRKEKREKTSRSSRSASFFRQKGGEKRRGGSYRAHRSSDAPSALLAVSNSGCWICVRFLRLLLRARRLVPAVQCGLDSSVCAHTRPCARGRCTHAHRVDFKFESAVI